MAQQIPVEVMEQEQPSSSRERNPEIPEQVREIGDMAARTWREFKESETYDRLLEGRDAAQEYIRTNPLASFGYALGAGFLLGLLMKRK
jgi:ElaB/YqjD/DUF883 family membrane-anchored ribosome-binding protein